MIKSNKGRVELEGTPIVLVGELGTAIQAVYQALPNAGIDKTFAEKNIRETCERRSHRGRIQAAGYPGSD